MTEHTGHDDDDTAGDLSLDTLRAVVELQRTELSRLLREQTRLNDRIDSLLRLHEREQVLRQQMQASLDRLAAAQIAASRGAGLLARAGVPSGGEPEVADLRARLERTETRFSALQDAVGRLVGHIERRIPEPAAAADGTGFVRVYAPG
jgi:hypothetical protein